MVYPTSSSSTFSLRSCERYLDTFLPGDVTFLRGTDQFRKKNDASISPFSLTCKAVISPLHNISDFFLACQNFIMAYREYHRGKRLKFQQFPKNLTYIFFIHHKRGHSLILSLSLSLLFKRLFSS